MQGPDTGPSPGGAAHRPFVIGLNPRSGGAILRERLTLDDIAIPDVLRDFAAEGWSDLFLLITCDRVEIFGIASGEAALEASSRNLPRLAAALLARHAGVEPEGLLSAAEPRWDRAAVRHLFAVAAALDSSVTGEPQILGQVKAAHRMAAEQGLVGGALESWLSAAYHVAKQVRTETSLGEGAVNIATVAVEIAGDLHGRLKKRTGCLLGTGEMGELLAERFLRAGLARMYVAHRREKRAAAVAERLGCSFGGLDGSEAGLVELLAGNDVVLAAFGDGRMALTPSVVEQALKKRRRKPILLVDTSIPPDAALEVGKLDGAFLYSLDDLETLAAHGRAGREQAARDAWGMVDAALARYDRYKAGRSVAPAIVALRDHVESLRQEVLSGYDGDGEAARATRALINRLLHAPSLALSGLAAEGQDAEAVALLGRIFDIAALKQETDKPSPGEDGPNQATEGEQR